MKHSPGPWKAVGVGVYQDDSEDHEIYAIASTGMSRPSKENLANARLIAAAPDLLQELRNIAEADPSKWEEGFRNQFREWAQSRARDAVIRATGEKP